MRQASFAFCFTLYYLWHLSRFQYLAMTKPKALRERWLLVVGRKKEGGEEGRKGREGENDGKINVRKMRLTLAAEMSGIRRGGPTQTLGIRNSQASEWIIRRFFICG